MIDAHSYLSYRACSHRRHKRRFIRSSIFFVQTTLSNACTSCAIFERNVPQQRMYFLRHFWTQRPSATPVLPSPFFERNVPQPRLYILRHFCCKRPSATPVLSKQFFANVPQQRVYFLRHFLTPFSTIWEANQAAYLSRLPLSALFMLFASSSSLFFK